MKRVLPIVLLVIVACWTMNSFAQTDPRIWNTRVVPAGEHFIVPGGAINYRNPNHAPMVYRLGTETVVVEPNFRVYPSTTTQSEVPIIASKVNPDWIFASSNTWNGSVISEGNYRSADGGNTWVGTDILNSAPTSAHWGDPGPAIGPDGRFYHSHLFDLNGWDAGMRVTYSTDFGATWANDITIGNFASDKNHTVVNEISGSPYYGRALVSWSDFSAGNPPITISWSSNGGATWSAASDVNTAASGHYCQGVNGQVGANGDFYLVWANPVSGYPYTEDNIGFAKSTDGGVTWTYNNNVYDCNGIRGYLTFYGASDIRVNGFPWMAVDISGGPRDGWIYVVTGEKGLTPAGNDPDIVMHISSDGGVTWSAGIRVNQDPLNNGTYQYMPAVCVGADGAVNVIYYDTRNATISGGLPDSAEVFVSRSDDGGATFQDFLVSDHAFKPKPISGLAGGYQGDYIGIAESNGTIYPYWCDDKSGIYQAWTTRITFGPPCPVEAAINPNPPAGAQNVSINLSQLTWENGAGSVSNELYFGTSPGSMTLVQSGTLATSWTIDPSYLPLNYFTNYYWQVVEIGDTCNKTGPLWTFKTIQDPNYVVVTDSLYPMSAQYWTGSTNGSTKIDGEINTVDPNLGWAAFDISSIPAIATIEAVNFYGYVNDTYYPYWSATPMPDNPVTAAGSTIYNDAVAGQEQGIAYIYSNESSSFTTGWHTYPMENSAVPDLQAAVTSSQGWFATGIVDRDFSTTYYINFDGWSQANPPFLQVTYHYIIPVELTSFTANANNNRVTLNWQTATETNNKGFEIQRSEVGGQKSEWMRIGYVAGFGTTTELKSYSFNDNDIQSGSYSYRLKQIDLSGTSSYSKEVEVKVIAPAEFSLQQNYPNPFNPSTLIKYSIPENQRVTLNVYNLLGQKVATLVNGLQKSGEYEIIFDGSRLSSGVYFYKLEAGQQSSIKKMILMK